MWEFHAFHKPAGEVVWSSFYKETGAQKDHCCIKVTAKEQLNGILSPVFSLQKEWGWQSTSWSEAPQPHHPRWLYELWPLKCLVSFSSTTGSLNLFSATWKWKVKVAQLCPTLWDPVDYTVHGILQARILEWVVFPFSRGSSQPRDRTQVSHIAGGFFTSWAIGEAQEYWSE